MACQVSIFRISGYRGPVFPALILLFLMTNNLFSQEIDYRAQSLFIYKFTKYVSWPESKKKGDFMIGVYGNSPVFEELETMAALKKGGNDQDIKVIQIADLEGLDKLHILYIASSKSRDISAVAEKLDGRPTLVVAERSGMARKGATISFLIMDNGTLKFEINMSRLKGHKLEISQELLHLGFEI
ncbi:MAG: YfiR family protein [Bacteroidales bacterium]|nr:YfiR family protein [Bacteroidales bacterium]